MIKGVRTSRSEEQQHDHTACLERQHSFADFCDCDLTVPLPLDGGAIALAFHSEVVKLPNQLPAFLVYSR